MGALARQACLFVLRDKLNLLMLAEMQLCLVRLLFQTVEEDCTKPLKLLEAQESFVQALFPFVQQTATPQLSPPPLLFFSVLPATQPVRLAMGQTLVTARHVQLEQL